MILQLLHLLLCYFDSSDDHYYYPYYVWLYGVQVITSTSGGVVIT